MGDPQKSTLAFTEDAPCCRAAFVPSTNPVTEAGRNYSDFAGGEGKTLSDQVICPGPHNWHTAGIRTKDSKVQCVLCHTRASGIFPEQVGVSRWTWFRPHGGAGVGMVSSVTLFSPRQLRTTCFLVPIPSRRQRSKAERLTQGG